MAIRSDKIGQSWLLPLDVRELIPEDHICNLVEVVVESIDVGEIEQKMKANASNFIRIRVATSFHPNSIRMKRFVRR